MQFQVLLNTVVVLIVTSCHAFFKDENETMIYDWQEIEPSSQVRWRPCFDNFTCIKLQVPLDYADPGIGSLAVAFMKYAARNPSNSTRDLLFNFGGPGDSGVTELTSQSPLLVKTYGSEHNLISFDPRGVSLTGPSLSCFPDDLSARTTFNALMREPVSDQTPQTAVSQFYLAEAFGEWCHEAIGKGNATAKYANTPAVARDMLTFVEAQNIAKGQLPQDAQLNYVGYSYGTILGATFAALHPDRIGRMILDGVVDSEDYYIGPRTQNLLDTDKAVEMFLQGCYGAGPQNCSFYSDSLAGMTSRLQKLIEGLHQTPIPVWDSKLTNLPRLADYSTFKQFFAQMLYHPIPQYVSTTDIGFPGLARVLVEIEQKNVTTLMQYARRLASPCATGNESSSQNYDALEALWMIGCIDGYAKDKFLSSDTYAAYAQLLSNESRWVGDTWSAQRLVCNNIAISPPDSQRWTGSLPLSANSTSFPILWVSNTIDPVTPQAGGHRMAGYFPGSRWVRQMAVGHTSIAAPSKCLDNVKQAYLRGELPDSNMICSTDLGPFGPPISQ